MGCFYKDDNRCKVVAELAAGGRCWSANRSSGRYDSSGGSCRRRVPALRIVSCRRGIWSLLTLAASTIDLSPSVSPDFGGQDEQSSCFAIGIGGARDRCACATVVRAGQRYDRRRHLRSVGSARALSDQASLLALGRAQLPEPAVLRRHPPSHFLLDGCRRLRSAARAARRLSLRQGRGGRRLRPVNSPSFRGRSTSSS